MTATTTAHTNCGRCGRKLTDPKSIATGYGPVCARKVATETTEFSPEQVAKAVRLVAAGGVERTRSRHFHGLYLVAGAYGTYQATTSDCTCQGAAEHGGCYHIAAVRLALASPATTTPAARYAPAA
ncbi:DUF6011 domain-containing protein [Frankia sp. Mgl5]|uniref:DUF6011 domain-containing protein n=1 Tax=Frankia sp. Mgl5 TaxID=2933793 RepID=UPI00200EFBC8|nr:DUF6011 domain-containing protein [Frankia sp. Mgl5]MCK9929444.1 DUF6011 domain-containing protein [Frankia sp. Mgl5]